jgi:zinc transport system substrate-binding protein
MQKLNSILIIKLALLALIPAAAHAKLTIVTSIKPLYNITAAIGDGIFTPTLLVTENISEHDFQLKPSQITQINKADLIFWIGPSLETALKKPLANIAHKKVCALMSLPKIKLLLNRKLFTYQEQEDEHEHEHEHHYHDHGLYDPHIWLSLDNTKVMAKYIAAKLSVLDPQHKEDYAKNLQIFNDKLNDQQPSWQTKITQISKLPIIVMHDAYQYLGNLNIIGTIVVDHDVPSSIKHIRQIKQLLTQHNVTCICSEPQLNSVLVKTLKEDHDIKHIVTDPLGDDLDLGKDGYIKLIDKLIASFYSCKQN